MTLKRTLVLAGGGAKGAYQAAVLATLMDRGGFEWSDVFGVSVGALGAAAVATGQVARLLGVWGTVTEADVYDKVGDLAVALRVARGKSGLYANARLRERLIARVVEGRRVHLPVYAGVTNMDTGDFELVGRASTELADAEFCDAVWASATMPLLWELVVTERGVPYADGGLRNVTPLGDALARGACHEVVVVLCNPLRHRFQPLPAQPDLKHVALRALEVLETENSRADIEEFTRVNDLVQQAAAEGLTLYKKDGATPYRYVPIHVIAPASDLGGTTDFAREALRQRMAQGRADAERFLASLP